MATPVSSCDVFVPGGGPAGSAIAAGLHYVAVNEIGAALAEFGEAVLGYVPDIHLDERGLERYTPQLYISGTASILGHLSQHASDARAQAGEIIVNLRAVMAEACENGLIDAAASSARLFKVYLRQPALRPVVETRLRKAFGAESSIVYLQADICRRELLLEIEAVCSMRPPD